MITTKADRLLRSLIDAGLSLTDFTILATKVIRIQRDFKINNEGRRERDRVRQQNQRREQHQYEQQLKEEEQRRMKGLAKLRELGYVTGDDEHQIGNKNIGDSVDQYAGNQMGNKDGRRKVDQLLLPYSKEINDMKEKQRNCCLTFNIDYDLRLNQQILERACRRAKRNIYELRADRFNRPEHRSILSVETATLHNKLKETIREINKMFVDDKSQQDRRHLQELLTYINQFEGDIDLLMCQMQYEPKVKETILFSPVTTDILDRMNLILHYVRTLAHRISTGNYLDEQDVNVDDDLNPNLSDIPTKVTYIIKIKTNDEISSSLSNETNVTIRLYGTYNKSPDIRLLQSIHKTKWQSGQIDLFNIELSYLGDVYAIEIGHDSQYSSWKVDWIEIIDDAANIYRFPLDRLFDQYSNENKTRFIIQRDIGPVNRLPTKPLKQIKPYKQLGFSTYTVQVKTGKQPNKVTDSTIFMELRGDNGNFTENICSANSAFKSSVFEPDQLDTFYLIWPYLAKIHSLHLLVQSEGLQPGWFCEYITVEDSQTGEQYKFIVNQLFDGSNPDDHNLKRQLIVYPEETNGKDDREEKDKPSYLLKLKTGEKGLSNMSTVPTINVLLKGDKGKSEPYALKSHDEKRKIFQENQTDEFILSSKYYVGSIKALQISSKDQLDKWFIETIIIRDIKQGQDYIFPIYQWMNQPDGTNSLTVHPMNEQKPDYIVYTRTISSELKGPDRSIKLLIQGNKGKHEVELNHPVTMHNTFQAGHKDEYYVENMKSLGELQSIEVDVTHPNIRKLGLDYIEIKDLSTNDSYRFDINRMLDSKNPKMTAKAEPISQSMKNPSSSKTNRSQLILPNASNKKNFDQLITNTPQGAKRPTSKKYHVSITTGHSSLTGTDPNVQLQLHGDKGTSEKIDLHKSETNSKNLFQSNHQDRFSLTIPDLGNLKSATLSMNGNIEHEWSISTLEIAQENPEKIYHADIHQTLGNGNKDKNELTIDLNERFDSAKSTSESNSYKIRIKTMNKQFLNKDTNLQMELIDELGQSEVLVLNRTNDNNDVLQKDKIDTFTINPEQHLGKLKTIKLSLTGSSFPKKDFYQPEFIEVFHPTSNKTYRIDYTTNDILNSDKNRFELTNSIKRLSDTSIREKAHPQGAIPAKTTTSKSNVSPYNKLADHIRSENDEEDFSFPNNTTTSSLSKELNSLSDKLTNSSSRQIRPGDRVKSTSRRQTIDQQAKASSYEADWYRRSIETNKDRRNDVKQIQLTSDKRISQTKFDQRPVQTIKHRQTDGYQNINRQSSREKKISSDEHPSKQQTITKRNELPNRSSISKTRQQLNELQREMMDIKTPSDSDVFQNNHRSSGLDEGRQSSLSKQTRSLPSSPTPISMDDQRQRSPTKPNMYVGDLTEMKVVIESLTPSNISELTDSTKPSRTSYEQSKTFDYLGSKETSNKVDTISRTTSQSKTKHDEVVTASDRYNSLSHRSMSVPSKSVPPDFRTPNTMPTQRSLRDSASPNSNQIPPTASQLVTESHPSQLKSKAGTHSTRTPNPSNKAPTDSFTATQGTNLKQAQLISNVIVDPSFDKYNSQPNTHAISAVTIHTIATKSDSDSNLTKKSVDSQGSEHSVQSKSLLSPDTAKKSRKHRRREHRQNTSRTSENTQHEHVINAQTSTITSDPGTNSKFKNHTPSANHTYLSKETSDIQHASRRSSNAPPSDNILSTVDLKPAKTIDKKAKASQEKTFKQHTSNIQSTASPGTKSNKKTVEAHSKDEDKPPQYTSRSSLTADKTSFSTSIQNHRLPNEISDTKHATSPKTRAITAKTNSNLPNKVTGVDHMSTVYEESERSAVSASHVLTSSFSERDHHGETIQDWLETSSSLSSSQPHISINHQTKSSSKEKSLSTPINKSPSPSNHHKKTINAKTKLTPVQSNTFIDYEFRVQTSNESQFDGTNEPVFIELMNSKEKSMKIPLINSMNNSRPFQKGQLDIFHLSIPKTFHPINKLTLFLPPSNKDPLHIHYCELQDRQTMTTLHFPIEKWLDERNTYHVEMFTNNNNNSLL